ncbi:MAG TPA: regulatory protein RecX [Flavobacteriales bacterium]|nr:regulatory protein RecX [Flavobacteriales bacterium]
MENKVTKKYTPAQARTKIESWCAYQERSHYEVKEKLYSWGLYSTDVNEIISHLISNNFLNEERFAEAFVSGKFKIKGWGRNKIKQALKLKKVSDPNIKNAFKQLDADDYFKKLKSIAVKKNKLIKENNHLKRKFKLVSFLATKGYEHDLINEVVKEVLKKDD